MHLSEPLCGADHSEPNQCVQQHVCVHLQYMCEWAFSAWDGHTKICGIFMFSSHQKKTQKTNKENSHITEWMQWPLTTCVHCFLQSSIDVYIYICIIYNMQIYKKDFILITSGIFFNIHYCNELLSKMITKGQVSSLLLRSYLQQF